MLASALLAGTVTLAGSLARVVRVLRVLDLRDGRAALVVQDAWELHTLVAGLGWLAVVALSGLGGLGIRWLEGRLRGSGRTGLAGE